MAARGNGVSGKAIAASNGTRHDANGAAVSGAEAYGEEFIGEWIYFDPWYVIMLIERGLKNNNDFKFCAIFW